MQYKRDIILRARILYLLFLIYVGIIIVRLFNIQYIEGASWNEYAQKNQFEYRSLSPNRGNIYTDDGKHILTNSLPFYRPTIDASIIPQNILDQYIDAFTVRLADCYQDQTAEKYKEKIVKARKEKKQYTVLNKQLLNYNQKKYIQLAPIFRYNKYIHGIHFENIQKRYKPYAPLANKVIGFVNQQNYGTGLEYSFNGILKGKAGEALFYKKNAWQRMNNVPFLKPIDGDHLITTINLTIQYIVYNALLEALKKLEANYGCVVIMEVNTGYIKAIANLNLTPEGNYKEEYNYAIGNLGNQEPGSTMKLASMLALFEETNLHLDDVVDTEKGEFGFYDKTMKDVNKEGFGTITVEEVIAKSSNIGVSKLVTQTFQNQPEKFLYYLHKVGITQPIHFQILGMAKPFVKRPYDSSWSGITLPWMSIGYEVKTTPLNVLIFYNAIANGGVLLKPLLVKGIQNSKTNHIKIIKSIVLKKQICSKETLKNLQRLLVGVVEKGTARKINKGPYKIAGKTGTTQKIIDGTYMKDMLYLSFVGYFPADEPKYSGIVIIDQPKNEIQKGASLAASLFKTIADQITVMDPDLHLTIPIQTNKDTAEKQKVVKIDYDNRIYPQRRGRGRVIQKGEEKKLEKIPYVIGMSDRDALYLLESQNLQVNLIGRGKVRNQSIPKGTKIVPNQVIDLELKP